MKIATNKDRLNELFDADPRNDTAIAEQFHVSKQAVSAWRNGTRSPKKTVLLDIAKHYNVSIEWLMGYDVPRQPPTMDLTLFGISDYIPVTTEAKILARDTDKLPPEEREQLLSLAHALYAKYEHYFEKDDDDGTGL